MWTTCTASISHVATSPFTTPVAGYQVCVVTAYGSDGTALDSLTVQREFSIVSAASMQSVYLKKMTLFPPIFLQLPQHLFQVSCKRHVINLPHTSRASFVLHPSLTAATAPGTTTINYTGSGWS